MAHQRTKRFSRNLGSIRERLAVDVNELVAQVFNENPLVVVDVMTGNEKAFNALVGMVMKKSDGQANPAEVNAAVRALLTNNQ
jgi:Asp-tRNA(Asn)/Glu-tRNA(Gln) amidotransferase B subunit